MTPAMWAAVILALAAALLIGVAVGRAWQRWCYAREALLLQDATRSGHRRLYANDMPDGRSAANYPVGRYADDGEV